MKIRKKIHDDWETPDWLLDKIRAEFGEFFDPCPLDANFNGLEVDWKKVNYINPPYNRKDKEAFILKAYGESQKGNTSIMLLPVSTSTVIFHEVILKHAEIRFLRGRVKFKGYNSKGEYVENQCGQHDSMLVIFKPQDRLKEKNSK
jgi:site-specific DNA-methyltransferase (adenine-specific)